VHWYNYKYLNNHCKCLPLDRVYCIKYLEINFDHRLKFNEHIYYVNNLLKKLLYKFRLLKNMLDIKTLRLIYLAFAQSVFSYGISTWGCTYSTHINVIYSTVNLLIKIILRKPKLYPTSSIYSELKIRTIIQVYERAILLYMYKVNISQFQPLHCYKTRLKNNCNLIVPSNNTNFGTQSPIIKGINLLRKYNINLTIFDNFKKYKKHINCILTYT